MSRTGFGALTTTFTVRASPPTRWNGLLRRLPRVGRRRGERRRRALGRDRPWPRRWSPGRITRATPPRCAEFAVTAAATEASAVTTHALTDATTYNVYVAMADDASATRDYLWLWKTVGAPVVALQVTTCADGTAPLFSGNPCASQLDQECPLSALHSPPDVRRQPVPQAFQLRARRVRVVAGERRRGRCI